MKPLLWVSCLSAAVAMASCPAPAGTWYIPMAEQVPGGFDHIQIRMCYPYQFDSPAMSAFSGPSPVGEQWWQTFLNQSGVFAAADGPDPGDETIHFSIWIAGDRETDRPAFQFQVYRGQTRVDNADIICFGSGEMDWMVAPGTWTQNSPIPPWLPGDVNFDAYVDGADYTVWADHYHQAGGWEQGDFSGDGFVDGADYTLWADNYTGAGGCGGAGPSIPEPATLLLMALGVGALMARRSKPR